MNLAGMKPGETATITQIGVNGPLRRRLMDMGVLVGEEVRMDRIAPLGDPLEVCIRGYRLSLRRNEAKSIAVEVAP